MTSFPAHRPRRWAGAVTALVTAAAGLTLVGGAATTATAVDRTATSISIRVAKTAIRPGGTDRVTGYLAVAPGHSNAGKTLTLLARPVGQDGFVPVGDVATGPRGGVSLRVAPEVTTKYRWMFAGDEENRPSRSGIATVRVRTPEHHAHRRITSLSIRAVTPVVGLDGTDRITGILRSHHMRLRHKPVILLARAEGTDTWTFEGVDRTNWRGRAMFRVRPSTDTWYRMVFLGSARFRPTHSASVHVGVRSTAISIDVADHRIDPGESTTISGVVTQNGVPLAGQSVQLRAKRVGSHHPFRLLATATSASDGSVSFTVAPMHSKRYVLFLPHTTGVQAARSDVVTVWVRVRTTLSIRGKVTQSGAYAVSGSLRTYGHALRNRWVRLEAMAPGETTWSVQAASRTSANGRVVFVRAAAPGTAYRLSFAGGKRFAASTSGTVVN